MRRTLPVLGVAIAVCVLLAPQVFAGGGFGAPPPDRTVGPDVKVSVVMEGPRQPESGTRQFSLIVPKSHGSQAAIFTGPLNYMYGCMQSGFPDIQTSTEQRFLGYMSNWAPIEVLDVLIAPFGPSERATIVAIDDISCAAVGSQEFLSFTAKVKFAR